VERKVGFYMSQMEKKSPQPDTLVEARETEGEKKVQLVIKGGTVFKLGGVGLE